VLLEDWLDAWQVAKGQPEVLLCGMFRVAGSEPQYKVNSPFLCKRGLHLQSFRFHG
jgi:hypothetical protein